MAIPPRNPLLILNIAIFSERRDFKEFTKILSKKRASLYLGNPIFVTKATIFALTSIFYTAKAKMLPVILHSRVFIRMAPDFFLG